MIGLAVLGVLAAGAPCADAEALARADGEAGLHRLLDSMEATSRAPLLTASERALPWETQRDRAAGRARIVCDTQASSAPSGKADRKMLTAIFERPEFAHARDREDIATDLARRFIDWILRLISAPGWERFSEGTRLAVLCAAFAAVLAVVIRLARGRSGAPASALVSPARGGRALQDPEQHLRQAREALASQPREAVRQGLLALLSALEGRRWARADRVKTNREIAAELGDRGVPPEVSSAATRLLAWFDRAFYSLDPVGQDAARGFLEDVGALCARVRSAA